MKKFVHLVTAILITVYLDYFPLFQSPHKYFLVVLSAAVVLKIPRFFHFHLVTEADSDGSNKTVEYATSPIYENPTYISFEAYWDSLMVTGFVPLIALVVFNIKIHKKVMME